MEMGLPRYDEVSIHALLAECDKSQMPHDKLLPCFNPRTPCGVRLPIPPSPPPGKRFQSTHSLRSATRKATCPPADGLFQSTHSLRSATFFWYLLALFHVVSIHALLAECDEYATGQSASVSRFQSTHSLRSATVRLWLISRFLYSFNPRTPCGVRLDKVSGFSPCPPFQSTHSLRSATPIVAHIKISV